MLPKGERKWVFLKSRYYIFKAFKLSINSKGKGKNEIESVPKPLARHEVYDWVKDIVIIFGKTQKRDASGKNIW